MNLIAIFDRAHQPRAARRLRAAVSPGPGRRILRSLGLQQRRARRAQPWVALTLVGAGALVGVGCVMLLAPSTLIER